MAAIATPFEPVSDAEERDFESLRLLETRPRILSVSECQTDHTALRRIVDNTEWRLDTANSLHEAFERLCLNSPLVVFSEPDLPDGTWKDVLQVTARFDNPRPSLVVTSAFADERLWSEVFHLGGYDVLTKPLVHAEVRRVLESIWTGRPHRSPRARGAS
jgi:DNA-binding NtrC family response regulator